MHIINKINKYLLEQHPLIWNTRLVWMLGINILVHLLFFSLGFSSVKGVEDLKFFHNLKAFFFETSAVYYNVLISIFVLLIWVLFYLRNNAFKDLYSVKKGMLFQQFLIIFFVIFISSSQYYSFNKGLTVRIKALYSWQEIDADIKAFNKTALFLTQDQENFEINKKKYPTPFPLEVAKTSNYSKPPAIDKTKPYVKYNGDDFQFYKIDEAAKEKDVKENRYDNLASNNFKYRIVEDITAFRALIHPSLYNFSKQQFSYGQKEIDYQNQLNYYQKILDDKNSFKIKEALKTFLNLAKKYKATSNLELEKWFQLIDNQPNYLLKELIGKSNPTLDNFNHPKYTYNKISNYPLTGNIPYSRELYFNYNKIDNLFGLVYQANFSTFNTDILSFLLVFSIFFGSILFVFKTTNMKTILLSFVASLVVFVLIVWLMSSARNLFGIFKYPEYYIMLSLSSVITIFALISYLLKWRKIIVAIFWSLSLIAVPAFFLFLSLYYIKMFKQNQFEFYPQYYDFISGFEIWFSDNGIWAIIAIWLFTIYLYSLCIRKLRARAA